MDGAGHGLGAQGVEGGTQCIKGIGKAGQGALAHRCQGDAARGAGEQGGTQSRLQPLDMGGDRAGCDARFLCGLGKTAQSGRCFECAQRGQGKVFRAGWDDGHFSLRFSDPGFPQN